MYKTTRTMLLTLSLALVPVTALAQTDTATPGTTDTTTPGTTDTTTDTTDTTSTATTDTTTTTTDNNDGFDYGWLGLLGLAGLAGLTAVSHQCRVDPRDTTRRPWNVASGCGATPVGALTSSMGLSHPWFEVQHDLIVPSSSKQ